MSIELLMRDTKKISELLGVKKSEKMREG